MCDDSLVSWHPDLQIWACLRRPSTFRSLRGCILHTLRTGASLPPNCEPRRRTGCCGVAARPRNAWLARLSCRHLCAWPGSTLLRPEQCNRIILLVHLWSCCIIYLQLQMSHCPPGRHSRLHRVPSRLLLRPRRCKCCFQSFSLCRQESLQTQTPLLVGRQ